MPELYQQVSCIHSLDESTSFLTAFKDVLLGTYMVMDCNDESLTSAIEKVKSLTPKSLFIFLGHGYSRGIYSPQSIEYEKRIFIGSDSGAAYFAGHDVILLSCKSSEFLSSFQGYNSAIGFGNIISSGEESAAEAEYTGHFRDLTAEDIAYFNTCYVTAVAAAVKLLLENRIAFKDLKSCISFNINRYINEVLKNKKKANRVELARLLFDFRNEMLLKQSA